MHGGSDCRHLLLPQMTGKARTSARVPKSQRKLSRCVVCRPCPVGRPGWSRRRAYNKQAAGRVEIIICRPKKGSTASVTDSRAQTMHAERRNGPRAGVSFHNLQNMRSQELSIKWTRPEHNKQQACLVLCFPLPPRLPKWSSSANLLLTFRHSSIT